jgi:hypothetical protein
MDQRADVEHQQGNHVNPKIGFAVAVAMVVGMSGCAQQSQMVRPSAAQLQALEPLPVVEVIGQDTIAAQDTFTAASINVMAGPGVPILVGAAGGALGSLIVNSAIKAEARRFAERHVQPLREALQGFDGKTALSDSLQQALSLQPTTFSGYTSETGATASTSPRLVVRTTYSMTPDFSALQVIADVSITGAGGAQAKPIYHNVLVYQSARQTVPVKTAEDGKRMLAQENDRYAKLHVDEDIAEANAEIKRRDPEVAHLRDKINREQIEHRERLAQASAINWDADTHAQHLAEAWATNHGEALKLAMRASGAEIAHMLQLDLANNQVAADQLKQPRTVFRSDTRQIEYVTGGRMISLASLDTDASLKTPRLPVNVPVNFSGRR